MPVVFDRVEKVELALDQFITDAHHEGVSYWQLFRILVNACVDVFIMAQTTDYVKKGD